ncbi:hypothetical protein G6F56_012699 [Rhizopus delemar]|nr:hypothetical protein G6F56_012699 [Rhizopus delemar]
MATMWRPRSDIGKLQHQDILFVQDDEGKLKGVTLKAREQKEIESKESKLGTIEETNICPVQSLTKALTNGASLNTVKLHANWSLKSDTLEKYYYKPGNQHERGRILTNSIFETDTEKRTTSEVGVEPTTIVLGTTHNGHVGETKTEDVVATRPWYKSWFMA